MCYCGIFLWTGSRVLQSSYYPRDRGYKLTEWYDIVGRKMVQP